MNMGYGFHPLSPEYVILASARKRYVCIVNFAIPQMTTTRIHSDNTDCSSDGAHVHESTSKNISTNIFYSNKEKIMKSMTCFYKLFPLFLLVFVLVSHDTKAQTAFKVDDASSVNLMNLNTDAGFLLKGVYSSGTIPATGAGMRFMWYPAKAALRAGEVTTEWDDANIGAYSTAFGLNPKASGTASVAFGRNTSATGNYAAAIGYYATSSAAYATSLGKSTTASGAASTAMGEGTTASGTNSTAIGYYSTASGNFSSSLGYVASASGNYSMAIGNYVSTNSKDGSFIIGDNSTVTTTTSSANNQMTMRFDGGYRLFSNAAVSDGLFINGSGDVGLGATTPDAKLHVVGQVKITGGAPGSGKVLTSDVNGLATWETPASGDITAVGSMTSGNAFADGGADDQWLGIGSTAGRIEFDNQYVDEVNILDAKVGIGTSTPSAQLHIGGTDGLLAVGTYSTGTVLSLGLGTRMHWYPKKAAFRAGYVNGDRWDDAQIGNYSVAFGHSTIASGDYSAAFGWMTDATGDLSFASGYLTYAAGNYSTAFGDHASSSGSRTTAMGFHASASGNNSTAIGNYVSTNSREGAFIIGDNSVVSFTNSNADNQMTMRFDGGYRLFTNSASSLGAKLDAGATAWSVISDRNVKENFQRIDLENLLGKIRDLPITEWNYKANDPSIRYIGPMAQDFWQAFHLGGTDSLSISTLAFDGVNMAAIQALEKRTSDLKEALSEIEQLKSTVQSLVQANKEMTEANNKLNQRLTRLESVQTRSAAYSLHSEMHTRLQEK